MPLEDAGLALRVHVEEAAYWMDHGEPDRARRMLSRGLASYQRILDREEAALEAKITGAAA